ncbi:UbiA-like protein EboC [Pedobacter faecalis]|uniref:UbiA-like protein EboC n=1 Tax=Pedobacter faecalis TaxID=3041495 RepID=UPI00254E6A8F|nr:UbiA-like protein EboC [Pedobacter sp. ELA7]
MKKLIGYLRLMRPANVVTSVADVLAGITIAGYFAMQLTGWAPVILLCISTIGLYSGGIIMNDYFDADLDAKERPERPIPSGLISKKAAAIFGGICFFAGIFAAGLYSKDSQYLAFAIMVSCLVYDKFLKHNSLFGPLTMGLCRGLNLLLGISIFPDAVQQWWFLALVPIVYIAAITMISRDEVHGGAARTLYAAAALYLLVIAAIVYFACRNDELLLTALLLAGFAFMIFVPLFRAVQNPAGPNIGKAVKAGVIALILMNAAWAGAFGSWQAALCIVILLPLSIGLSKAFAVT